MENLVDVGDKTATEAKFIPGLLEMFNPPCMSREVILPESAGRVNFSIRDSYVPVFKHKFTVVVQDEFVNSLSRCKCQDGKGPIQDIHGGHHFCTLFKNIPAIDAYY